MHSSNDLIPMTKLISIITPSFNRAGFIRQAIESVLVQDYPNTEHIVMDGDSTDGTLEVLSAYPYLKVISEPDRGVYDALNKGVAIAHGEIIGFLNSDDRYETNILGSIVEIFEKHPKADAVIGRTAFFEDGSTTYTLYPQINAETLPDQLFSGVSAINGWFFRREVFTRVGTFDQTFPVGADRDFLIRLYLSGLAPVFVDHLYYYYRQHPGSLTINEGWDARERFMLENRLLAQKYIPLVRHDPDLHRRSKTWHDMTSIELMILFARQKRFRDVISVVRMAVKYNWAWLLIVAAQSPGRLWNKWKKKHGSNR